MHQSSSKTKTCFFQKIFYNISSTAEDFGRASGDKLNCNIKTFWASNLKFTVLCTPLIFRATHLCTLSLRAAQPEFVRTWGNWSTQAAKHILPPQGWFPHHSFIALPIPVFHVVPNQFVFIQEKESATVRFVCSPAWLF